jgi:hypothetical protein
MHIYTKKTSAQMPRLGPTSMDGMLPAPLQALPVFAILATSHTFYAEKCGELVQLEYLDKTDEMVPVSDARL